MPQFFITGKSIDNDKIYITDPGDIKHIVNVLRFSKGNKLKLIEEEAYIYNTEIEEIKDKIIITRILDKEEAVRRLSLNLTLAQSILKSEKQDIVVQKATELGVRTIIPIISKNTVVKIESEKAGGHKIQRWQKIAYESSKQCQRSDIPEISHIITLNQLMELTDFDVMFVCVERQAALSIKEFLIKNKDNIKKDSRILIIIGPEGGWDDKELDLFKSKNITAVSLGMLILRAETASINAISDVIYEYEL